MISDTNDFSNILSIIGVFAVAAFKILPSISSLIVASQKFNYSFPSYEKVFKELETNNLKFKEKDIENYYLKFDDEIKINDLSFKYTNTEKLVLKNISFAIKINSSVGIYGVSGSGKSTLLDCLIGFNKPTDGSIFVDNQNINQSTKEWLKLISYVPQNIFLLDDTILSNIAIGDEIEKIDYKKLDLAISVSQLKNFIEELPQGKETIIGERGAKISGGQRQRIGIARAIYKKSPVLLLDEATSALDSKLEEKIIKSIFDQDFIRAKIIISHKMSTLKYCDKIYELDKGILNIKNK